MTRPIKNADQQDAGEFLKCVKVVEDRALTQIQSVFSDFKLPSSIKAKVLIVLREDLSYLHYCRAVGTIAGLQWVLTEAKKSKHHLRTTISKRLAQPLLPPANLRERMMRESVEPLVESHDNLSKLLPEIETKVKEARRVLTAVRKRGKQTQVAMARLRTILKGTKWSARKTAKFVYEILNAWNPAIAPDSAESVRVSSIRSRTTKQPNSPL